MLVIDPTHKDGDAAERKAAGGQQRQRADHRRRENLSRLAPLGWTDAQKGDAGRYAGDETIQFFRNSGPFKAGDRVKAGELLPHLAKLKPENFAVFGERRSTSPSATRYASPANGWDVTGKHRDR